MVMIFWNLFIKIIGFLVLGFVAFNQFYLYWIIFKKHILDFFNHLLKAIAVLQLVN